MAIRYYYCLNFQSKNQLECTFKRKTFTIYLINQDLLLVKQPEDCSNIQDIRSEIDSLDRQTIAILGKRFKYVKAAAKFKKNETSVKALPRFKTMLEQRRIWAEAENLNPNVIEKIYRDLVSYFINEELEDWKDQK